MNKPWRHIVIVLAAGCILPPPVSLDNGTNRPPYIVAGESIPQTADVDINVACDVCTFGVAAEDPDTGDNLTTRWFWDYDEGATTESGKDITIGATLNDAPRSPGSYTTPGPVTQFLDDLKSVKSGNVHTLQVIVSDRGFVAGEQPLNQAPGTGGFTATLRWTVSFITRGTSCDTLDICSAP